MPLYRVRVTYETVVVAKDREEARTIAKGIEVFGDAKPTANTEEITKDRNCLPFPWTPNCHPYGDDHNTIAHYLK